jgi:hypothetical protein
MPSSRRSPSRRPRPPQSPVPTTGFVPEVDEHGEREPQSCHTADCFSRQLFGSCESPADRRLVGLGGLVEPGDTEIQIPQQPIM